MSFKTYSVGRGSDTDIQLSGQSVSRRHLELTSTNDGRYYLIDANSSAGTKIQKEGNWEPIKQGFVEAHDYLLLGKESIQVKELIAKIRH
jgi:pSer/pThr/pTyr-binding forkhead associated (FHA) protein